jgi:hypothetical protein
MFPVMDFANRLRLRFGQAENVFRSLFSSGLADPVVIRELCPDGWAESPLRLAFHPTPEQSYEERVRFERNSMWWRAAAAKKRGEPPPEPEIPTFEQFLREREESPDRPPEPDAAEFARLLGLCLWDIFSDNNRVLDPQGRDVDIGSFRGAAGTIADFFNDSAGRRGADRDSSDFFAIGDYIEFYMGTMGCGDRTDLQPVYRLIFARLQAAGCDWEYSFPRLHVFRFDQTANKRDDWTKYDPSSAVGAELEECAKDAEFAELQENLEKGHREAIEETKNHPPPATVLAYRAVFHRDPCGWPPWEGAD